ncbi:MAG: NADH-quinone oxidoreductase subunit C [Gammaproteobacteria bacterium]
MSERLEALASAAGTRFGDTLARLPSHSGELTFEVAGENLLETAAALRDEAAFGFEQLIDVCVVDYLTYGEDEWRTKTATDTGFSRGVNRHPAARSPGAPRRFAVVYHLLSLRHNRRLRLKLWCPDDDYPVVPSVNAIWPSANWFEREAFDLYGVLFEGHPDLRRILTDYGFAGHPFRKDFPLSGEVEMRYDPTERRIVYEPVEIAPRTLAPKVIRHANTYNPINTEARPGDE